MLHRNRRVVGRLLSGIFSYSLPDAGRVAGIARQERSLWRICRVNRIVPT